MMKKAFLLLLILIFMCGCSKEDYDKYKSYLSNGPITCEYEIAGHYVYLGDIKRIAITATLQGVTIRYTLSNGESYDGNIVTFKFNGKGEISGLTEESKNTFAGYTIHIKGTFNYKNFLNQYSQHNTCPDILRILYGNNNSRNYDTEGRLYDADYGQTYNNYLLVKEEQTITEEKPNPCGVTPTYCLNGHALACQQYELSTKLDGDVTVELGRVFNADGVSLDKYFIVNSKYGRAMDYNYNTNEDSRGGTLGTYTYMIRAVDWNNLFPSDCTFADPSIVIIDEKDIANSANAHITTTNSSTITDYEMFIEPDEIMKKTPAENTFKNNGKIEIPPTDIQKVYFCQETRVLRAFKIVGFLLFALKIIVPLIIIILGSIDFAKAVTSSGDKANKEALTMLVKRLIIGIIIFLLPTILDILIGYVDGAKETGESFSACTDCLFNPFNTKCGD